MADRALAVDDGFEFGLVNLFSRRGESAEDQQEAG